jgi:hypothetical protein
MKGFKNTTRTQYSMGGDVGGYAKGGAAKPAMARASKPAVAKAAKPAQAKAIAASEARKAPVKKNEGGKMGKMPPIGESVKSGNRASKMTAAEMREMEARFGEKKRPSPAASAKSANRVSSQEAAEARHLGVFKNGGKVAKYAEGGPVGQPTAMGQKPGGMPAVQPLGGPMGQMPGVTPVGQPSASGSFNAMQQSLNQVGNPMQQSLNQVGGPQAPTPEYYSQGAMQMLGQQPQMGMTPQQRSFGVSGGQDLSQMGQQPQMGQKPGGMPAVQPLGGPQPYDFGHLPPGVPGFLEQYAQPKGPQAPMQPPTRNLVGTPENPLTQEQIYNQERAIHSDPSSPFHEMYFPKTLPKGPQAPMQPPSMGVIDNRIDSGNFGRPMQPSGGQSSTLGNIQQALQQIRPLRQQSPQQQRQQQVQQRLMSRGMARGEEDGPGTAMPPKQVMPPTKQPLPTPPMKGPGMGQVTPSRAMMMNKGGLTAMPKKGKC